MTKYVLLYTGGDGMPESQEEIDALMAAWGGWFESMGAAVVDGGNPTGAVKTIAPGGAVSDGGTTGIGGYSLVNADSHDAAVALAQGCPVLAGGGNVEVHEASEM